MRSKWMVITGVLLMLAAFPLIGIAQEGSGQFWVRAFEDRNNNGLREAGEPLITRGVLVELRDSGGTIIASELLEQSTNATQGLVGFQRLSAGQYTLLVSAPELTPTTPTEFTAAIQDGALPTVVEFGGQRLLVESTTESAAATAQEAERQELARLAFSGLGALVVIGVMSVIGMLIYGVMSRPRTVPYYGDPISTGEFRDTRRTTGSMRAVRDKEIDQ